MAFHIFRSKPAFACQTQETISPSRSFSDAVLRNVNEKLDFIGLERLTKSCIHMHITIRKHIKRDYKFK